MRLADRVSHGWRRAALLFHFSRSPLRGSDLRVRRLPHGEHVVREGEPALPPEPCDVVLLVNVYHHLPDGPAALRALAGRLRPGGRIVNVDFHAGELPVGPPPEQKVSREAFLAAAAAAGLELADERSFLPYQYLVALRPRP